MTRSPEHSPSFAVAALDIKELTSTPELREWVLGKITEILAELEMTELQAFDAYQERTPDEELTVADFVAEIIEAGLAFLGFSLDDLETANEMILSNPDSVEELFTARVRTLCNDLTDDSETSDTRGSEANQVTDSAHQLDHHPQQD